MPNGSRQRQAELGTVCTSCGRSAYMKTIIKHTAKGKYLLKREVHVKYCSACDTIATDCRCL